MEDLGDSSLILSGFDAIVGKIASGRPPVTDLWSEIFPASRESHGGQLIGVQGPPGSGKSLLLQQSLTHMLAPLSWGGKQSCALSMDLTHANGWRLVQRQLRALAEAAASQGGEASEELATALGQPTVSADQRIQETLNEAFKNLVLVDCYYSEQLLIAFRNIDNILWSNAAIALVAIDGLDAFYWDADDPLRREAKRHVTHCQELLERLKELCSVHKVSCIYTLEKNTEATSSLMASMDDFDIVLTYDEWSGQRTLNERPIVINENGIEFLEAEGISGAKNLEIEEANCE